MGLGRGRVKLASGRVVGGGRLQLGDQARGLGQRQGLGDGGVEAAEHQGVEVQVQPPRQRMEGRTCAGVQGRVRGSGRGTSAEIALTSWAVPRRGRAGRRRRECSGRTLREPWPRTPGLRAPGSSVNSRPQLAPTEPNPGSPRLRETPTMSLREGFEPGAAADRRGGFGDLRPGRGGCWISSPPGTSAEVRGGLGQRRWVGVRPASSASNGDRAGELAAIRDADHGLGFRWYGESWRRELRAIGG